MILLSSVRLPGLVMVNAVASVGCFPGPVFPGLAGGNFGNSNPLLFFYMRGIAILIRAALQS